jgi:amidase
MTRSVRDAALVLNALVGVDAGDAATAASAGHTVDDYTQALRADGLKGARIGVAREFFGGDPRVDALMEQAIEVMRRQGAEIIDPVDVPSYEDFERSSYQVMLYEFKHGLEAWLADLGDASDLETLDDIIAWNEVHADQSMPYFGQEILIAAAQKGGLDSKEYRDALAKAHRIARQDGLDKTMDAHRLDAIIGPTGSPAWTTDLVNGDHFGEVSSSTPAAVAGYPNISVPAGFIQGLPVGISFFGRAWSEATLLRLAYAFEQATGHRRAPSLADHLEQP